LATIAPALYAATSATAVKIEGVAIDVKAVRVMLAEGKVPKQLTDEELAGQCRVASLDQSVR
jgi:hypothetical protein